MAALPLTSSGKVDRKVLPPPALEREPDGYVAPRSPEEKLLAEVFAEVLRRDRVSVHDNFFNVGGHSLLAVRLMAQVAKLTGQTLPLATLFQHPTIAELARELQMNLPSRPHQTLVHLHGTGHGLPLFCVHPVGGHVLCYLELARAFQPAQRVYGLQAAPVAEGASGKEESLPEVASGYIAAIKTVQPHGPYQLLGWSLGGVLAFEMARQLRQAHEDVALLALLDSYPPDAARHATEFDEAALRQWFLSDLAGQRLEASPVALAPEALAALHESTQVGALYALFRRNLQLVSNYHPGPYEGRTLLLRAEEGSQAGARDRAWAPLCMGGLDIIDVTGDHYTLLSPSNAPELAQLLATRLLR